MTQSKPALEGHHRQAEPLTALVPVTEELLSDAPALAGYVTRKAGEKLAFKVTDAIVNGTGVGQPLGIMNAACKVKRTKVGSQTASTFHADNAVKMMARMPAQSFAKSVWLINQDVLPQILKLGFAVTTASAPQACRRGRAVPAAERPGEHRPTARCSVARSSSRKRARRSAPRAT
jgi:HK97 family phage major capsid protein